MNELIITTNEDSKEVESNINKIRLDATHKVEWAKNSNLIKIICEDEDITDEFNEHSGYVTGVLTLKLGEEDSVGYFISCGKDNRLVAYQNDGHHISTLEGHTDEIVRVVELDGKNILSISKDNTLRIWDVISGIELIALSLGSNGPEDVRFFNDGEYIGIRNNKDISYYTGLGEKVLTLNGVRNFPNQVLHLENIGWLTVSTSGKEQPLKNGTWSPNRSNLNNSQVLLWSSEGEKIKYFPVPFDLDKGCIQIKDELIVVDDDNIVTQYSSDGKTISVHESNKIFANQVLRYIGLKKEKELFISENTGIEHFQYLHNPLRLGIISNIKEVVEEQELKLEEDPDTKEIWDFFNRPIFKSVKTALKNIISPLRSMVTETAEMKEKYKVKVSEITLEKSKRKRWMLFTLALYLSLFVYLFMVFVGLFSPSEFLYEIGMLKVLGNLTVTGFLTMAIAVPLLIVGIFKLGINRCNKRVAMIEANINAIQMISLCFEHLISDVKRYRRKILEQIPVVKNPSIFSDLKVPEKIDSLITGDIQRLAMSECGLEPSDIIFNDNKPIILPAWSLIQDKSADLDSRINKDNEQSFWFVNGKGIFAVQYIQYIFLTADKIDVFSIYYDFIKKEPVSKMANAFYYKDVTNIAKNDVSRNMSSADGDMFSATEITLSVSSGEKIQLTILSSVGASAFSEDKENTGQDKRVKALEREEKRIRDDGSLSEEEREEDLDILNAQRQDLKNSSKAPDIKQGETKADEAIKNIRSQLRHHKNVTVV